MMKVSMNKVGELLTDYVKGSMIFETQVYE